jgi:hypothetical protein
MAASPKQAISHNIVVNLDHDQQLQSIFLAAVLDLQTHFLPDLIQMT